MKTPRQILLLTNGETLRPARRCGVMAAAGGLQAVEPCLCAASGDRKPPKRRLVAETGTNTQIFELIEAATKLL
jgi:hypothetical protein